MPRSALAFSIGETIDGRYRITGLDESATAVVERLAKLSRTQIVFLTRAWSTASDRAAALREKGVRVVAKPINAALLAAVLASAHREREPDEEDPARALA